MPGSHPATAGDRHQYRPFRFTAVFSPPPQQNAAGIALEAQLITPQFAAAFGYTPLEFLVSNWTARASFRPANGPFTFAFSRDSIKDSQLSYSGLRDPGTASLSFPGFAWGGVVANQGTSRFSRGDALSGSTSVSAARGFRATTSKTTTALTAMPAPTGA